MSELTAILLITFPAITYLIGRYYIKRKLQSLRDVEAERDYWKRACDGRWDTIQLLRQDIKDLNTKNATLEEQLNNQ